jgi:hypothetical protein
MDAVYMDANGVLKPSPGNQTALATSVGSPSLNINFFAPAVARGAATPVMVEEDWLQPGTITNPFTPGVAYQPPDYYLNGGVTVTDTTGYDWYDLNFGGNGVVVAVDGAHFVNTITTDEFSVYLGRWNSIPIHPFGGPKDLSAMGCGPRGLRA